MTQKTVALSDESRAQVMRLTGIALLWVALSALAYVPNSTDVAKTTVIAILGFFSFAAGLSLFADSLKRDILAKVAQGQRG